MLVGTLDLKTVTLHPDKLWLEQEKDMTLFQITNHRLIFTNSSNPKQGMRMIVVMKRKIMSEIMTTYFPSILLTLITFATTFFKRIYFEASLSVNLTTMLVMTTIFISKMEGLPPTSATKMIDYWLILCQLVPFAQVVLLTAMDFLSEEEQGENLSEFGLYGTIEYFCNKQFHNKISEKEEPQQTTKEEESTVQIEEEEEAKPKEAIAPMKRSSTSFVPILRTIGRFFVVGVHCIKRFLFREENDALDHALCLFLLLLRGAMAWTSSRSSLV